MVEIIAPAALAIPWGSGGEAASTLRRAESDRFGAYMPTMWYAFQGSIMFAVMASNIHWHWSRNVYVAAFATYIVAGWATVLVNPLSGR